MTGHEMHAVGEVVGLVGIVSDRRGRDMQREVYAIEEYDQNACEWFVVQVCLHRDHAERECAKWSTMPVHRVMVYAPKEEERETMTTDERIAVLKQALEQLVHAVDAHQAHAWATSDIDTSAARAALAAGDDTRG